jgi:hypothetical protein
MQELQYLRVEKREQCNAMIGGDFCLVKYKRFDNRMQEFFGMGIENQKVFKLDDEDESEGSAYIINNITLSSQCDPKGTLFEPFLNDFRAFISAPSEEEKSVLTSVSRILSAC